MTERNYNPNQKERKAMKKQEIVKDPKLENPIKSPKKEENKTEKKVETKDKVKPETDKAQVKKETPKIKKTDAVVNAKSVPISTKYSIEICRFIKNKPIDVAIKNLEQVIIQKKAIPMRGEYGHKKGKGMAGGRYPKNAAEHFIKLLNSLSKNAIANGLDEPVVFEAISNVAARPMGRFGRWQRKRTHITLIAKKNKLKKKKGQKK